MVNMQTKVMIIELTGLLKSLLICFKKVVGDKSKWC